VEISAQMERKKEPRVGLGSEALGNSGDENLISRSILGIHRTLFGDAHLNIQTCNDVGTIGSRVATGRRSSYYAA